MDGKSYRAELQVRAFNKSEGIDMYASRIVTYMPNRATALAWEVQHTNYVYDRGHSLDKHYIPWPINKPR